VIQWLTTGGKTLVGIKNLEKIVLRGFDHDMSAEDWDEMVQLLLTSTSLQELQVKRFRNGNGDRAMGTLTQYLIAASTSASLRKFEFVTSDSVSDAAFESLCNGVTKSTLQKLTLGNNVVNETYLVTAAESLALAISTSSLEQVTIGSRMCSALLLLRTEHVLNFFSSLREFELVTSNSLSDAAFALSDDAFASLCDGVANSTLQKLTLGNNIVNEAYLVTAAESLALAISRSSLEQVRIGSQMCSALLRTKHVKYEYFLWKPLLRANIPLGLWPHIVAKLQSLPEAIFNLLKKKPDLVQPHTEISQSPKKRQRRENSDSPLTH
jgi:hypothetical protein